MSLKKRKRDFYSLNSLPDLIKLKQKPSNFLEIENMVLNDMKKKIVQDEMNEIQFYDIQPLEPPQGKTHNDTNFRSIHFFADMSQIRGTKFHTKMKRTYLDNKLREKIQEEPGQRILMREIYEQLEENRDYKEQKPSEVDPNVVTQLDQWHKKMKALRRQQGKEEVNEEDDFFLRKAKSMEQKRRMGTSGFLSRKKDVASVAMMALPNLIKEDSMNETKRGHIMNFKKKMMSSLHEQGSDRKITKTVEKYLNQGEGLSSKDFEKLHQKKVTNTNDIVQDFTVEGLKRSLHTLIKMQITSFSNAHDRSTFYEKQSNQIVQSVQDKYKFQEQEINRKFQTLNTLRTENHEIHDRLRQIKTLLQQLNEEFKTVSQSQKELKLISKMQQQSQQNRQGNIDNLMQVVQRQADIEADIANLKDTQEKYSHKLISNNKIIDNLENEILKLQKHNKALLKAKQGFLAELLLIGLDCRNSGLGWIIQDLWETGERVGENQLPQFIDQKGREFLFMKAKKSIELTDLVKKSHDHFNEYKRQINYTGPVIDNSIVSFDQQSIAYAPSIISKSTFQNSFAMINSSQIKAASTKEETELLLMGVTMREKKCIDNVFNDINTSKNTINDIIYKEAQKKLGSMFKIDDPITDASLQETKDRMIKQYADIQLLIHERQAQLVRMEQLEIQRMIKEIDFKNYLKRYNCDAMQILAALFGYHRAEREIIKNGMMRKL